MQEYTNSRFIAIVMYNKRKGRTKKGQKRKRKEEKMKRSECSKRV